ncbi:lipopolysaccharide biosynthesis protein [Flavobacterium limnosediminis]|nr:MATE family efflux transporter [Flavobacterium limnosediminis]
MFWNYCIQKLSSQATQSALLKGLTGFCMFISISLLVRYLGESGYGIWVLVFSFSQWGLYFDFGVSNVLKSKIPELLTKKDFEKINGYISESVKLTLIISILLLLLGSVLIYSLNLTSIFNIKLDSEFTQFLFLINGIFFCLNFVLSINKSLFIGILNPKIAELSATITQILFLLIVCIFYFALDHLSLPLRLVLISVANGLSATLINGFYFYSFFRKKSYALSVFAPINKVISKDIFKNGMQFMIIQTFMVVIFFSDPYFIASYSSPEEVSIFDVINKLYQLPLLVITSGLASFWPFFSQKFHEKDFEWFRDIFKKFERIFLLITIALLFFTVIAKYILQFWIGKGISDSIGMSVLFLMTLAILSRVYFTFYANFFNGINKLKSQIIVMGVTALIKIPLTVYLLKNGYGLNGIFLQLFIFMLLWALFFRVESSIVLNKHAK